MNRKIIAGFLLTSTIALASCGIKDVTNLGKKEAPTDVIKELQTNLVDSLKSTALGKTNAEGNSNIDVKVVTPVGKGDLGMKMKFRGVGSTGDMTLDLNGSFDVQMPEAMTGTINGKLDVISTLNKIYLNLQDFNIKSTNPQLMVYNSFIPMFKGKWFYIENDNQTKNITKVFSNISFRDELSKYSLFKVNKEISEYKYNVSLDKENIAIIIYNVSKQLDSTFSGNIEQIKDEIGSGDITGVISIENNKKYFTFSGDIIASDNTEIPLEVRFTEKKFYISTANGKFVLDLDKDGDNFKGYALFKDNQSNEFKLAINGTLSDDSLNLGLVFNENGILVDFKMTGEYKEIDKVDVTIPKDAVSIQDLQNGFGQ